MRRPLKTNSVFSIGNDIVDLNCIDFERTVLVRFYSKIITKYELNLYKTSFSSKLDFPLYIWLLWSVKESVYKYIKRLQPETLFSPLKINVTFIKFMSDDHILAKAEYNQNVVMTSSKLSENYIATHTYQTDFSENTTLIHKTNDEKISCSELFINSIQINGAVVKKNPIGYPELFVDNILQPYLMSFSDHGEYFFISYKTVD